MQIDIDPTWEQRAMQGSSKFEVTKQRPNLAYHPFAELIGLRSSARVSASTCCSAAFSMLP